MLMKKIERLIWMYLMVFIIGRIGLLAHEFIGHALPVIIFGGEVTRVGLYIFGGGWVEYRYDDFEVWQLALVQSGGCMSQLGLGLLLLNSHRLWKVSHTIHLYFCVTAIILWIHALYYWAESLHYGQGDGEIFHELELGIEFIVILTCVGLLISNIYFVRKYIRSFSLYFFDKSVSEMKNWLEVSILLMLAAACYFFTVRLERILDPQDVYSDLFTASYQKEIEKDLMKYQEELIVKGKEVTSEELMLKKDILMKLRKPIQIEIVLIALMFLGTVLGKYFQNQRVLINSTYQSLHLKVVVICSVVLFILMFGAKFILDHD